MTPDVRRSVTFSVLGKPEPKGSTKAFVPKPWAVAAVAAGRSPRAVVTNDNPAAAGWQSLIRGQAQTLYEPPFAGAVQVSVVFRLPRPKSLPRRVQQCVKKPDIDKLARLVLDGLTGVLFLDDAVVVDLHARKVYATAICLGCGCPLPRCEEYRRNRQACCPECKHLGPGVVITVTEVSAPNAEPAALFREED